MNNNWGGSATPTTSTSNRYSLLSADDFPSAQATKRSRKDDLTQKPQNGKFLIISHADPDQDLNKLCPFIVMKSLEGYTSNLQSISKLRNGTLLIETKDQKQTAILYKAETLGPVKINVKDHPTLNTTRGTIFSHDLLLLDEEYILNNLKQQNVIKVERIKKFNEARELVPTPSLIITFQGKTLPLTIKAGYLSLRTRMYYPAPMKCKSCHKFGHTKKKCRGDPICVRCAKPQHKDECDEVKCANCTKHYPMFKEHPANDRNCVKYQEEKAIIKIMVDETKMYKEARSKFNQMYPKSATESTFAAAVKTNHDNDQQRRQRNFNQDKRFKPTTNNKTTPQSPPPRATSPQPIRTPRPTTTSPTSTSNQRPSQHQQHHTSKITNSTNINTYQQETAQQQSTPTQQEATTTKQQATSTLQQATLTLQQATPTQQPQNNNQQNDDPNYHRNSSLEKEDDFHGFGDDDNNNEMEEMN